MTRIPLVPVYPSFLFIFQEEKIIAEIKKWNSKYCILISDSCFQCLYADRKFWSRRYLFPHLCIRISDNTGYPDREFFFLIQEERDSFKELIAKKDQLNRMQRSVAKTFQEVLELTGSLYFMFRSTPRHKELSTDKKVKKILHCYSRKIYTFQLFLDRLDEQECFALILRKKSRAALAIDTKSAPGKCIPLSPVFSHLIPIWLAKQLLIRAPNAAGPCTAVSPSKGGPVMLCFWGRLPLWVHLVNSESIIHTFINQCVTYKNKTIT